MMDISELDLNVAVAKLQRQSTEIVDGHCAIREPFDPESSADKYAEDFRCMWYFYEPSLDWAIAGPIIQEQGISLSNCDGVWSASLDQTVFLDRSPLIAAMRVYVAHHAELVDKDGWPAPALAVLRVHFASKVDLSDFEEVEVMVKATTLQEAQEKAKLTFPSDSIFPPYVQFLRWEILN